MTEYLCQRLFCICHGSLPFSQVFNAVSFTEYNGIKMILHPILKKDYFNEFQINLIILSITIIIQQSYFPKFQHLSRAVYIQFPQFGFQEALLPHSLVPDGKL